MKLIQQLLEMAKKKKKSYQNKSNIARKEMAHIEATVKHGAHATAKDKARDPKHTRRKSKISLRDY